NGHDERKLSKIVENTCRDNVLTLNLNFSGQEQGQYGLDVYCRENLDNNLLTHCCKYLINVPNSQLNDSQLSGVSIKRFPCERIPKINTKMMIKICLIAFIMAQFAPTADAICCAEACSSRGSSLKSLLHKVKICADCSKAAPHCAFGPCNVFGCNCQGGCRAEGPCRSYDRCSQEAKKFVTE
uniref:Uncharacterized protein n=1 Tax=Romanomermis culicivorax TaxID=13658 RepID=A0A915JX79_ROMCU